MGLRAFQVRFGIRLRSWIFAPSPEFDSEFIAATQWATDYIPQGDKDPYPLIAEFAEQEYDRAVSNYENLDRKADELIRLTTTVSGAILTAAATKFVAFPNPVWAYLSIVPTAISIAVAVCARTPGGVTTPISPRDLLGVADLPTKPPPYQIQGVLAASFHVAMIGVRTVTTWKAIQIRRATIAFVIAFIFLLRALV